MYRCKGIPNWRLEDRSKQPDGDKCVHERISLKLSCYADVLSVLHDGTLYSYPKLSYAGRKKMNKQMKVEFF